VRRDRGRTARYEQHEGRSGERQREVRQVAKAMIRRLGEVVSDE
jgi:hypothetical protein